MKSLGRAVAVASGMAFGSGCLSVVTYDNYYARADTRNRLAAEALAGEVAVGLVGGLAYSLGDDVTLGDGLLTGVGAALLIDLQAAVLITIVGLIHHASD